MFYPYKVTIFNDFSGDSQHEFSNRADLVSFITELINGDVDFKLEIVDRD